MRRPLDLAAAAAAAVALPLAASLPSGFAADGSTAPAAGRDRWSGDELGVIASLSLGRLPPSAPDASNAVDGRADAAASGKRLFGDVRFNRNQAVSCASCHAPDRQFQHGLPVGRGVGVGTRRAMPLAGTGHGAWLFWDGRKDSLWAQPWAPGRRGRARRQPHALRTAPADALPGGVRGGVRADACPGRAAAGCRAARQRRGTGRVAGDRARAPRRREPGVREQGKALAAYEKTLTYGESRFDRYARAVVAQDAGNASVLTTQEVARS